MEITSDNLDELIECDSYHEHAIDWGERAWIAKGRLADVVYWDTGNTWCDIMHVFVKNGGDTWLKEFFKCVMTYGTEDDI